MASKRQGHSWDDIRYFLAVARAGTLSAAAERLDTEHTTVARHIRSLEDGLNSPLFHRSNTGYELTSAGERLLATAEAMESAFVSARSAARSEGQLVTGTVRIGTPDGFGSLFLAPRMRVLADQHPGLEIEILATARLFSLSKREADIAISLSTPQQARVASRRLTDYRLHVYAARSYLAAAKPIGTPDQLGFHPFVGYIEDLLFTPELNYLHAVGANIEARIRSTNILAQVHATRAGSGLCILPTFIASAYPDLAAVLPGEIALKRSFYMHIHDDNRRATHVREVASFISAEVERNRALFMAPPAVE